MELRKAIMLLPHLMKSLIFFATLTTFTFTFTPAAADTSTFLYGGCARIKYSPNSPYESNLDALLTSLVNSAAYTSFNKFTLGSPPNDVVYGLYQCRPDLPNPGRDCFACVQRALSQLGVLCVDSCGGAVQLEGCFVKYDNATFLGVEDKAVLLRKCGPPSQGDELARRDEVLSYFLASGTTTELFRVGQAGNVKGVAQCVGDLSVGQCQDCLGEAIGRLKTDCGLARWGDMFLGKCYVRYSTAGDHSFGSNGSSQDDEIEKTLAILIGLIAGVALIIIFLAFLRKLCEGKDGK
uniref:Gnk2-homologous domain-containing protein n=1 Tax=Opuntia streptacantha TaxID=393608 RepID=A0A7C8YT54_OPUST